MLKYDRLIRRFIFLHKSIQDKEDFYQDLALVTLEAMERFDKTKSTKETTYLWCCYKNELQKFIAKNNLIRKPYNKEAEDYVFNDYVDLVPHRVEGLYERNIKIAKQYLNKEEYQCVLLYTQGYNVREIGKRINKSRQSVSNKLAHSKVKLKGMWFE